MTARRRPRLVIFDLDGTLTDPFAREPLAGVREALGRLAAEGIRRVGATNQGGVGYRYAYEARGRADAAGYPTLEAVLARLADVAAHLPELERIYVSLHSGRADFPLPPEWADGHVAELLAGTLEVRAAWRPEWRKPAPGMLERALADLDVAAADALMVGDREDDRAAATAAGVPFAWAKDYF